MNTARFIMSVKISIAKVNRSNLVIDHAAHVKVWITLALKDMLVGKWTLLKHIL